VVTARRRILLAGLTLAMAGIAAHAQADEPPAPLVGAYGAFEPLDDEAKAVFKQATEPQAQDRLFSPLTVARQVVAGMNFCFTADRRSRSGLSRVRIFIFKPLHGSPRVTKIEETP
jgi:hypothetical protein